MDFSPNTHLHPTGQSYEKTQPFAIYIVFRIPTNNTHPLLETIHFPFPHPPGYDFAYNIPKLQTTDTCSTGQDTQAIPGTDLPPAPKNVACCAAISWLAFASSPLGLKFDNFLKNCKRSSLISWRGQTFGKKRRLYSLYSLPVLQVTYLTKKKEHICHVEEQQKSVPDLAKKLGSQSLWYHQVRWSERQRSCLVRRDWEARMLSGLSITLRRFFYEAT